MSLRNLVGPLCEVLEKERIGYAIIGGYAVAAWGRVRGTQDMDILCEVADLERLKIALGRSGWSFEHRTGDRDDPVRHVIRIPMSSTEGIDEVEIIAGISDAPTDIISRSRAANLGDLKLQVAGPEDMIVLKLLAGSALDIQDALGILRSKHSHIDFELLRSICPPKVTDALHKLIADTGNAI